MTTVLPNGELQSNPRIAYNKGYEKGRADEQIHSIEDAKKQATEYLDALDKAKEAAYQQGAREFAEIIKCEIEKYWYRSELDMGAENVNNLIDCVLAEWQKEQSNAKDI